MRKNQGESGSIFSTFYTKVAWELWSCLILCWKGSFGKSSNGEIWKAIPLYLMWCLWRERNARCFEGKELILVKLKFLILKNI